MQLKRPKGRTTTNGLNYEGLKKASQMSNTPNDPLNPPRPPENPTPPAPPPGPWVYSGNPTPNPGYYTQPTPTPQPPQAPAPAPASPIDTRNSKLETPPTPPSENQKSKIKNPPPAPSDTSLAGIIDTIEAIIIALIVALTFRAFVVEAFVIPTGSMAPTLLGAHFKVICPKCGYEFDREADLRVQAINDRGIYKLVYVGDNAELGDNTMVPCPDPPFYCPNCRYPIAADELPQYLGTHALASSPTGVIDASFAWTNNGDRILVLKYLYSVKEPDRWDVIVFKEPMRAGANYIKRLVGKPGETVQIVNGDIYVGGKDATSRLIQRKPEDLQASLWQLVYNNDYYPSDEGRPRPPEDAPPRKTDTRQVKSITGPWLNPWQPETHPDQWAKGPTMTYAGKGPSSLVFHNIPLGLPPAARDYPPYGLNTLGYNNDLFADDPATPRSVVGDLRLETVWSPLPAAADPSIQLTLGRTNNCYRVTWSRNGLLLERYNLEQDTFETPTTRAANHKLTAEPVTLAGNIPLPQAGKSYRLAMNNVDHAVQFYIDGKKVLWFDPIDWTAAKAIDDANQFPPDWNPASPDARQRVNTLIRIDMSGPGTLAHLKLLRDLYYTQISAGYESTLQDWFERPLDRRPATGVSSEWPGHATGTLGDPVTLGPDEFFALGDNSRKSQDSRMWYQVYEPLGDLALRPGIVPRRYLLGKAFFVYWPAGFRPAEDLPILQKLPLVPNTGDMRMIR